MGEFKSDKLQVLLDASPSDLFLGFSSIGGDGVCLNRALDCLPDEQRQLLITVMKKGGRLTASKEIAGDDGIAGIAATAGKITNALKQLRKEFEVTTREYVPS